MYSHWSNKLREHLGLEAPLLEFGVLGFLIFKIVEAVNQPREG
jgi:hypothetical protein